VCDARYQARLDILAKKAFVMPAGIMTSTGRPIGIRDSKYLNPCARNTGKAMATANG